MSEPSQWAKDAERAICDFYDTIPNRGWQEVIQSAIDQACAAKDQRITALEALIADCPECSRVMKSYEPKP